jgi:alpha-ketoglutarate-dependent taurine dioxygenase
MNTADTVSRMHFPEFNRQYFEQLLDQRGYVYMDEVPNEFDQIEFLESFGSLMPQYDGELVWSIKADRRFDNLYHSLNTKSLLPHTECYEYPGVPPKYLALWCLVPPSDNGGQTTLADLCAFTDELSEEDYDRLRTREYDFVSSAGVQDMRLGCSARHPVIEGREGLSPIMRFSYNCIEHRGDPFILDIRERVVEFFFRTHVAISLGFNDILIWNNHRIMHARNAYSDRRRHLRRVWLAEK